MKRIIIFVVFNLFLVYSDAENNTFIYTPNMAQMCKEHICRDGYNYQVFYSVEEMKEIKKNTDVAFEMHIGIQASSCGLIVLSPVPKPGDSDPVYEIVVGGTNNTHTELRRNMKRNGLSWVKTPDILTSSEFRGFYIKISQDGVIEFGKEGEVLPLLTYKDVSPHEIKYFSFAAWPGIEVKYLYNCPIPSRNGTELSSDSQEVDRPISIVEQLKKSRPSTMPVNLGINVKYDAFQSKLATAISVVFGWTDDSMARYLMKYNGTDSLNFAQDTN